MKLGKYYELKIIIKTDLILSAIVPKCIKITVDGPRRPRKRKYSTELKTGNVTYK
jgi:hypothetical protein